jgi:hypothetical protein
MKILVIDIETTGFLNSGGTIVEVGMVELCLETGEKKIVFDSLCHEPGPNLTLEHVQKSWIVQNGYITVDEIRNSPRLSGLLPEIQLHVSSYHGVTAFNLQK